MTKLLITVFGIRLQYSHQHITHLNEGYKIWTAEEAKPGSRTEYQAISLTGQLFSV